MNCHKFVAAAEHDNRAEIISIDIGIGCVKLMRLISSRCSIFYFLQPSVSAWVRDEGAVTLYCSKDGYISIYCIHVESVRSPVVFSQISEQSPGRISCVTQPGSSAQGLAWGHFLGTSLWTNWLTTAGHRLASQARKGETLLPLHWALVSHLPEEQNPAFPQEDARGMDVGRCSGSCLCVRDWLVLLLKCHHLMCTYPENSDAPILTTMVKNPAPMRRKNKDFFRLALVHAWNLPGRF